ncbi:adenosylmethionine--8-amino-7-oxononanoate transaminase [Ferruginibacter paludis]|uniref:adenosylmethionine--8-amino-7-oxononanoate transaminase n=1 Tax=Ferruginibacter paludis TaxID=1310417 RepID=UPI0025B37A9F|nr:adenosylmethionine--8-amino-7-oxononanoate transaminase [Ferruginibacter paludis]MDN3654035.1 adenosylmethionine--8-amino-7-oxononanoate transaminase [Ferruginibacter paludis]
MATVNSNYIWHPFTQMKTAQPPLHVVKAKNCTLYTDDGKEYIDAIASWWVNIHGHCNEYIANAIAEQARTLEHVIFAGFTHTPAIELSKKLINILPAHFAKVFFSDDGSTSVEVALKMAIQYWYNKGLKNKTTIIAFENAYHGDTFGSMSVAERNEFNAAFKPFLFDVKRLPLPNENNSNSIKQQLYAWAAEEHIAAFIFEPLVQGAAGMLMYEAKYLDALIAIAREKNILCIADEVMTGFGRTGKNFAINYLKNEPDIICLSKGITGGFMPLGVTVCTQQIFDAFYDDDTTKTFFHGHSYTANPLACAAANASTELLIAEKCQQQIQWITNSHRIFADTIRSHPFVKEVRQQGTILAVELSTSESSSYFNNIQITAYQYYLSKGIFLRPLGNIVYIMPPYCIKEEELNSVYTAIKDSLFYLSK